MSRRALRSTACPCERYNRSMAAASRVMAGTARPNPRRGRGRRFRDRAPAARPEARPRGGRERGRTSARCPDWPCRRRGFRAARASPPSGARRPPGTRIRRNSPAARPGTSRRPGNRTRRPAPRGQAADVEWTACETPGRSSPALLEDREPVIPGKRGFILPEGLGWRSLPVLVSSGSQSMRIPCLFVLSILLAACHEAQPAAPVGIQGRVSLARAASCESLTRSVQDTAVRQMRSQLDAWKDASLAPGPAVAAGGATPQSSGQPASYSTTNTQVAGVDEADFVKN